jgi:hypothetical protein
MSVDYAKEAHFLRMSYESERSNYVFANLKKVVSFQNNDSYI